MFAEWYKPNSCLEFPRGGSQAMVNALVRSVPQAACWATSTIMILNACPCFMPKCSRRRGTHCSACVLTYKQKSFL